MEVLFQIPLSKEHLFKIIFNRYFFVPALGYYSFGSFTNIGTKGSYWTSSAHPDDSNWAYCLTFSNSVVTLDGPDSSNGSYTMKFE